MSAKADERSYDALGTHTWALVLAAGEGRRLSNLTTDANGITVPKQFCSLEGGPSLLTTSLDRARSVVADERVCVVVADQHRHWWAEFAEVLPTANVFVQSHNRGTANGILFPLLGILARDEQARIVVLLGIEPEDADAELGYIVPGEGDGRGTLPVRRFMEKPESAIARRLISAGALWNSLIFAAGGRSLFRLFERRCPEVVAAMQIAVNEPGPPLQSSSALRVLYERLPNIDFSRHILESAVDALRVRPVPHCGWTDLGTVRRVADTLNRLPARAPQAPRSAACFDLASALRKRITQRRAAVPARNTSDAYEH